MTKFQQAIILERNLRTSELKLAKVNGTTPADDGIRGAIKDDINSIVKSLKELGYKTTLRNSSNLNMVRILD